MNLPYAEACFNIAVGSLDKWASITRVFHPLIKIYGQTFFFSSSMRILPLPLLPLLLSFLSAEIRRHRHQLSRHALRVRDIDNFTIIQQYNFITIQFSKIRISSPPILRGSRILFIRLYLYISRGWFRILFAVRGECYVGDPRVTLMYVKKR